MSLYKPKPKPLPYNATLTLKGKKHRVFIDRDEYDYICSREKLATKHEFWEFGTETFDGSYYEDEDHYTSSISDILKEHGEFCLKIDLVTIVLE